MRKNISVFFAFLAFIFSIGCMFTFSASKVLAKEQIESELKVKSNSAYLMDYDTKTVIYKQNELERKPIASMCKVMTLLIIFEQEKEGNISFDEMIEISANASGMGGSQVFLESGASYKCSELVKSIAISSANDSCVALAEKIAGSEESFVNLMNEKAKELGMDNTFFVNCTGLPKSGQYSCAKDVAEMFYNLIGYEKYYGFAGVWMDTIEHPEGRTTQMSNTNKLIRFYAGCDSGKTGYTSEAGHCLVASAKRGDMRLISVVIKAPDSKTRFADVSGMFNHGFAFYENKIIVDCNKPFGVKVEVEFGKKDSLEIVAEKSVSIFSLKKERQGVELEFVPTSRVVAPVNKGDIVGKLNVYNNGTLIDSVNMLSNEYVACKTYFDVIFDIAKNWVI